MLALGLTYRFTLVLAGAAVCAVAVLLLLLLIWELGIVRRRVALATCHSSLTSGNTHRRSARREWLGQHYPNHSGSKREHCEPRRSSDRSHVSVALLAQHYVCVVDSPGLCIQQGGYLPSWPRCLAKVPPLLGDLCKM